MRQAWKIKTVLVINYFLFAILLNSVGTIILQTISHFHITKSAAANLDAYKDITIAVFSFITGMLLPRLGYKNGLLIALAIIGSVCFLVPIVDQLWIIKLVLIATGLSFALIKIASYATVGLITDDENEHASFISFFEGIFMVGSLSGLWLFSFFVRSPHFSWIHVFWVLSVLALIGFLLTLSLHVDKRQGAASSLPSVSENTREMLHLIKEPLVILFIVCIFMYVFVEQGLLTWMPTFNNMVLHISREMSIEMTSFFSAAIALGRIFAGLALRRFYWFWFSVSLLLGAMLMITFMLPHNPHQYVTITHWSQVSWQAFLFPAVGIFIAPVYPIICSTLISAIPKNYQSGMMGLILVFSAIGGSVGSKLIGVTFGIAGGQQAIGITLLPLSILLITLFFYRHVRESNSQPLKSNNFNNAEDKHGIQQNFEQSSIN